MRPEDVVLFSAQLYISLLDLVGLGLQADLMRSTG
jgi:hypothetical protein